MSGRSVRTIVPSLAVMGAALTLAVSASGVLAAPVGNEATTAGSQPERPTIIDRVVGILSTTTSTTTATTLPAETTEVPVSSPPSTDSTSPPSEPPPTDTTEEPPETTPTTPDSSIPDETVPTTSDPGAAPTSNPGATPDSTVPETTVPETTATSAAPPSSDLPRSTTTDPEPEQDVADDLPSEPTAPLPPVNIDWQSVGTPGPLPAGQPGASLPVPGRVPAVSWHVGTDDVDAVLATIRQLESGGRYGVKPNRAGASGAYQYIPSTWARYMGYAHAYMAPPVVQDARARLDVLRFLEQHHGDVSKVPVMWYFPVAVGDPSWMDRVPNPAGGNTLTVREYQWKWLDLFEEQRATVDPAGDGAVSDEAMVLAQRSLPAADLPSHGAGAQRSIVFPVLGPVDYADGWGNCRDGCSRRHEGTDIIGVRMQPLLAAVDGTVHTVRHESHGISGAVLSIRDDHGWRYNYFHLNNDMPGTDDAAADADWRLAPGLAEGDRVTAGQIVGYMGDSGNSEGSVPHLHFEFRDPTGTARPSYWSLRAAEARQACTIGLGPWSFPNPPAPDDDDPAAAHYAAIRRGVETTTVTPSSGVGEWRIDTEGRVTATGDAALVVGSGSVECAPGPTVPFGSDGAGWTAAPDIVDDSALVARPPTDASTGPSDQATFEDPSTGEAIVAAH